MAIASGKIDVSVEAIQQDNQCHFGEWLYGPTFTSMDKVSIHYEIVKVLHSEFHDAVARILMKILDGNREEGDEIVRLYNEFTAISAKLIQAMIEWKKDLQYK
ncbi:MAG: CZB domain-containing protein [Georgfuchsia sp.]